MAKHDFISGVTDAGKPHAAKGGFPYPGHKSQEHHRLVAEAKRERAAYARSFVKRGA